MFMDNRNDGNFCATLSVAGSLAAAGIAIATAAPIAVGAAAYGVTKLFKELFR